MGSKLMTNFKKKIKLFNSISSSIGSTLEVEWKKDTSDDEKFI